MADSVSILMFFAFMYRMSADIIHRRMRGGAEDVVVFGFLEDARRAAIHQHQHLLQFFGDRRHGEAVAGADIAEHDIDIVALIEVAQFLDLLGRAAVLVDDDGLDLHAAEAHLLVRRGPGTLVQLVDDELAAVAGRHAETVRGGPGQERHDAEFETCLAPEAGAARASVAAVATDISAKELINPRKAVHDVLPLNCRR